MSRVFLITGMQAAGKTTVGPLLASRLGPPAAALDGDVFYRMVYAGKAIMTPDAHPEAVRQLQLRYDASALVAQQYADAGFDFVVSDIILGDFVKRWLDSLRDVERHLVVLNPSAEAIVKRELGRGGANSYRDWQLPGMTLLDAVRSMQESLSELPAGGLWLDTSDHTAEQTVDAILAGDSRY